MKHSVWYLIPFLLAALYFVDTFYEKNLALPQPSSLRMEKNTFPAPAPVEARMMSK